MLKKILLIVLAIFSVLYLGIWLSIANVLKAHIKGYMDWYDQQYGVHSSYQLNAHGFPLEIVVDVEKYHYASKENQSLHDFSSTHSSPIQLKALPFIREISIHFNGTSHDQYFISEDSNLSRYFKKGNHRLTHFQDKDFQVLFDRPMLFEFAELKNWKDYVRHIQSVTVIGSQESLSMEDASDGTQEVWWNYTSASPYVIHLGWSPLANDASGALHITSNFHDFDLNINEGKIEKLLSENWKNLYGKHRFSYTELDANYHSISPDLVTLMEDMNLIFLFDLNSYFKLPKLDQTGLIDALASRAGQSFLVDASANFDWPVLSGVWTIKKQGSGRLFRVHTDLHAKDGFGRFLIASRGFPGNHSLYDELDDLHIIAGYDVQEPNFWSPVQLRKLLINGNNPSSLGSLMFVNEKGLPRLSLTHPEELGRAWVSLDGALSWSDRCPHLWDHTQNNLEKKVIKLLKKYQNQDDHFQRQLDGSKDLKTVNLDAWSERGWLTCSKVTTAQFKRDIYI